MDFSFFASLSPLFFFQDPPTSSEVSGSDLLFSSHLVLASPFEHPYNSRFGFELLGGVHPQSETSSPNLGGNPFDLSLIRSMGRLEITKPIDLALAKPYLLWGKWLTTSGTLDLLPCLLRNWHRFASKIFCLFVLRLVFLSCRFSWLGLCLLR